MTTPACQFGHQRTSRLLLDHAHEADIDDWHSIHADPRVWGHFPSGCHTSRQQTKKLVRESIENWQDGLGYWSAREESGGTVIGCGGCRRAPDFFRWNLYYRFRPEAQGRGYATDLARAAIEAANTVEPDRPVVAYMLERNVGSWRVAEKVGLTRIWVGPDEGNPDPDAVRYVYADHPDVAFAQ